MAAARQPHGHGRRGGVRILRGDARKRQLPSRRHADDAYAPTAASPIDGVWTNSITEAALQDSPLLYEADEVNDENWGDLTFTFENGRFTLEQTNPRTTSSYSGTFEVDGDVL